MDYIKEISAIIRGNDSPKTMMNRLDDYHANDIAEVMHELSLPERKKFYRVCSLDMLAEIFEYLDEEEAGAYLDEMDIRKASAVVSRLDTDTAVGILEEIDKDKRALIIDTVDPDIQKEIRLISSFDDDEIGSRMTVNFIVIKEGSTVKQAMNELVRQAEDNDNISTLFVEDENGIFYGAIDLKDLITARSGTALDDIIATSFQYVYATEQTEDCIEKLKDYSETLVPVLDDSNRLLGVITSQNIIEAADEEMGEDYAMLAGLTAEEDLNETLPESMKKVVASLTLIVAFQSLILDMAGNVGTQSLAVTIRVLTDEHLTFKQKCHLVIKETRVGFFNGALLGGVSFLLIGIYLMVFKSKDALFAFSVSGCIGLSLLLAMIISATVGTLIPLFFKKINIDPAVASGPLITTVNDLVAVVTYYGTSWILLLNVLHLGQ